jgi:kynurenine formamidase
VSEQHVVADTITEKGTRLVDLSLGIHNNMPSHKFFPGPVLLPYATHDVTIAAGLGTPDDPMTYAVSYLATLEHVGTHVDAPYHINASGASIDQMSLDWYVGPAVCLDLRHIGDLEYIDVEDLERGEAAAGVRIDGHIVLLCTGFHNRHWPRPEVVTRNPGLTAPATHWLADRRSRMHGVEGPSTDRADLNDFPSHRVCRDRNIYHFEWLVNLEQLLGVGEFRFYGFPLKIEGGTGSPVRAVAELPAE